MDNTQDRTASSGLLSMPEGLPRKIRRIKANGLLFVGDPHMTCVRPGRRLEENFLSVPLDKIAQAREIAEQNDLFVVFLGDMVDNPNKFKANTAKVVEDRGMIISGFAQAMNFRDCVTIVGNHDKHEVRLTPDCTLAQMRDLRLIDVIEPGGPYAIIEINGEKVGLGGTCYGEPIPKDVRGVFGEEVDRCVWLTHDLFIFDHQIPVLRDPPEIKGVDLAVNGHDHESQAPRQIGQTLWHNIGNITRMAVDQGPNVPAVWQWDPQAGMKKHALRYNEAAFDMVGIQVKADVKGAHEVEKARAKSLFSELIVKDSASDFARSGTGDVILEDIDRVLAARTDISEPAQLMVRNLHRRAPEKM